MSTLKTRTTMQDITLTELQPKDYPTPTWHEIKPATVRTFQLGDDPELVHFLKLGYDMWVRIFEDGYGQDPWLSGLQVMTSEEIQDTFKIDLNQKP